MFRRFLFLAAFLAASFSPKATEAQGYAQTQLFARDGVVAPTVQFFMDGPVNEEWVGWSAFGLVNENWAQAYFGPTYSPAESVKVSLYVGLEQNESPWRIATSVFWAVSQSSYTLTIIELGGSGWWYKVETEAWGNEKVGLGAYAERFSGAGPYGRINLSPEVLLWAAPVYDFEQPSEEPSAGLLVGIRYNFTW